MRKLFLGGVIITGTITGCGQFFINERTSRIYDLNTECLSQNAWHALDSLHSVTHITDSTLLGKVAEIKDMPFKSTIYLFNGKTPELIAVADKECVRYVYNPVLSEDILDGLSTNLSKEDKERIGNTIQSFLREFQCVKERNHRYHQEWDED